jgi:cob(I)alamin adenosyltransferase
MKIYTKTGDRGDTGLLNGRRVSKDDLRVQAYGEVDELNAALGLAVATLSDSEISKVLIEIQKDLFSIGAQLAEPPWGEGKRLEKFQIDESHISRLEQCIDKWETELIPLHRFILPGGSNAGAALHLARTICRRAERQVVHLSHREELPPTLMAYLNRLSDFLFVLARFINHKSNSPEILW